MILLRMAAFVTLAIVLTSHVVKVNSGEDRRLGQKNASEKCAADPDPRYNRERILDQLAAILKQSIPENKIHYPLLHADDQGKRLRFFVYDLTEPENIYSDLKENGPHMCIRFIDNHVYHFSPFFTPYSFSHIVFLEHGELKVFKLLNCKGKGDSLDDVVMYLDQKLKDDKDKDKVIGRVKNYREFGSYFTVDERYVRCEEALTRVKS